jgi:hypothetical protein
LIWLVAALLCAPAVAFATDAGERAEDASEQAVGDDSPAFDASLTQSFSAPETPRVGDDLKLTVEVEHPKNAAVTLPDGYGTVRWELENTERSTTATQTEGAKTSLELTFRVFRPGATTLPAFDITVLDEQGRAVTLSTEPVETKIISVLDAEKKADLLPPQPTVPVWVEDYTLAWIGGALGAAGLVALVVFMLMRGRGDQAYVEPERPAHVIALEKLSALSPGDLLERGKYMLFYVRMSEAVREYLGRRYGFRGTELTTTEILDHLEDVEWPDALSYEDVRDWMHHCDLIKFSGMVPSRQQADDALRRAFAIVELTRPPEKPDEGEEEDPAAEAQRVSQDPDDYEPEEPRSPYAPPAEASAGNENDPVTPGRTTTGSETRGETEDDPNPQSPAPNPGERSEPDPEEPS